MKLYSNELELWPHELPRRWWKVCVCNMACRVRWRLCSFSITNRAVQYIHKSHSNYQVKSLTSKQYSRQQLILCYICSVHVQLCSEQGHIWSISQYEPVFFYTTSSVNKLITKDKLARRSGERDQFQVIIINPSDCHIRHDDFTVQLIHITYASVTCTMADCNTPRPQSPAPWQTATHPDPPCNSKRPEMLSTLCKNHKQPVHQSTSKIL